MRKANSIMRYSLVGLLLLSWSGPTFAPRPTEQEVARLRAERKALLENTNPGMRELGRIAEIAQHGDNAKLSFLQKLTTLANDLNYRERGRAIKALSWVAGYGHSERSRMKAFQESAKLLVAESRRLAEAGGSGPRSEAYKSNVAVLNSRLADTFNRNMVRGSSQDHADDSPFYAKTSKDLFTFILKNKIHPLYELAVNWLKSEQAKHCNPPELMGAVLAQMKKDKPLAREVRDNLAPNRRGDRNEPRILSLSSPEDLRLFVEAQRILGETVSLKRINISKNSPVPVDQAPLLATLVNQNGLTESDIVNLKFEGVPRREAIEAVEKAGLPWLTKKLTESAVPIPQRDSAPQPSGAFCRGANAKIVGHSSINSP